jgi:hypothetical protein
MTDDEFVCIDLLMYELCSIGGHNEIVCSFHIVSHIYHAL